MQIGLIQILGDAVGVTGFVGITVITIGINAKDARDGGNAWLWQNGCGRSLQSLITDYLLFGFFNQGLLAESLWTC